MLPGLQVGACVSLPWHAGTHTRNPTQPHACCASSAEDRAENIRRIGEVAKIMAESGGWGWEVWGGKRGAVGDHVAGGVGSVRPVLAGVAAGGEVTVVVG